MRSEINLYKKRDNICFIQFEDLVYKYDETLKKIYNFTGLSENEHINKFIKFDPNYSILNTKLWKNKNYYSRDIVKIEDKLSEYCFE